MAKKTFDVSVYTTDWRNFEFEYTLEQMYTLLKNLRDYSFIRLWNEYVNKMTIATVEFENAELLDNIWTCVDMHYIPGDDKYASRQRIRLQRKRTWTSDFDEKEKTEEK